MRTHIAIAVLLFAAVGYAGAQAPIGPPNSLPNGSPRVCF